MKVEYALAQDTTKPRVTMPQTGKGGLQPRAKPINKQPIGMRRGNNAIAKRSPGGNPV